MKHIFSTFLILFLFTLQVKSQSDTVIIDINLDVKHTVGNISTFDRSKFVAIHADVSEREWDGNNFTSDLRNDFLNQYDVYMGRNTGGISWYLGQVAEDSNRPGFADSVSLESMGTNARNNYASNTNFHSYENRNNQIICAQLHPFWPDGQLTRQGWALSQTDTDTEPFGTATGEYMGRFIKYFYGSGATDGQPTPLYAEVINEPLWHLVDYGSESPQKIFEFHNAVATEIKKQVPDIKIGGFCTAFPDFDKNNFAQWDERWKLFMDIAGENMDFWTIHLYDFPSINNGKQLYRKGSNMEATLDMMEQYSYLSFGEVKPFVISEFGAQMHDYFGAWSPYRDWLHLKSVHSMMMQFMERPNLIASALNFLPVKAEWGTSGVNETYNHRLLRRENEPTSYSGQWVYTDMVKTYQLWSDVKGTRVDSKPSYADVLSDVYIDGTKVYVIVNNLDFKDLKAQLNINGTDAVVSNTKVKSLQLNGNQAELTEPEWAGGDEALFLGAEGTVIVEITYDKEIVIDQTLNENKYYATSYFKPIMANSEETFEINNVDLGNYGEALLRLGIGRDHGKSLSPIIKINGQTIEVPSNFRGGPQTDRNNFFGVLEIPVPYNILQTNNTISVSFSDGGGYISSVILQTFKFSKEIERNNTVLGYSEIEHIKQPFKIYPNPAKDQIKILTDSNQLPDEVCIQTLSGKEIINKKITNDSISLKNIPPGMYIIKFKEKGKEYSQKLLIN